MSERVRIPAQGRDRELLLGEMRGFRDADADWMGGRTWSLVYYPGEAHYAFLKEAHNLFFSANGLNPMAFRSLKRMESEVVQMTAGMLHAGEQAVGTMTSGGTESILMAVKAARDRARRKRPWIRAPELVAPRTLHVAFEKACHYFGLRPRYAPVGADFRADPAALERLISRNTVLVAASAPQYPHGVVDPIEEIGAIAQRHKIPFHVDACFGGFMLPWLERLGHPVPVFDFRVPGVTSMSADVHKYGFAAKGASVVVYRDMSYLKHQFFICTDWPGGIYASPTMAGTRPGGSIAAAWATLMAMGESGYLELAREALETTRRLREAIDAIEGLQVLGPWHCTVCTYGARDEAVNMFAVADRMEEKGWGTDRQQNPACIHLTVNAHNASMVDRYVDDLREAAAHVRAHPELADSGNAAMYGMMAKVPIRGLVRHSVGKVMEAMYSPEGGIPDLTRLGERPEDGFVLRAINRYGDRAMAAMDWIGSLRRRS